jgi:hypothetical protein
MNQEMYDPPKRSLQHLINVPSKTTNNREIVENPLTFENVISLASMHRDEDLPSSKLPFVWKLYEMLEDMEQSGNEDIVSWVADGKAFKVHKLKQFTEEIIPAYFKQSKYKSFQRQLYFYAFTRITSGPDAGAYGHPKFVRGIKTLCLSMTLKKPSRNSKVPKHAGEVATKKQQEQQQEHNSHTSPQQNGKCTAEDPSEWMTKLENLRVHGAGPSTLSDGPGSANPTTMPERTGPTHGDTVFAFDGMPFHFMDIEFSDLNE